MKRTILYDSSDNGQVSCEAHIPHWGYRLMGTWHKFEKEDYQYFCEYRKELVRFECEICQQEGAKQLEKIIGTI